MMRALFLFLRLCPQGVRLWHLLALAPAAAVVAMWLLDPAPPGLWQCVAVVLSWLGIALLSWRRAAHDGGRAAPPPPASLDGIAAPLMRFDSAGQIVEANREARILLGLGQDLPSVSDLFADLGRPVRDWFVDVAAGSLPGGSEVVALRSDADSFLQVSLRADGHGGTLAVLQDATAVKRLEAQLSQGQKMQVIGQLAGGIAHDFNNLLTAITGHCDLLLMRHGAGDASHPDLNQIRQNANRAAALVAQLLAFSRKQTRKPEILDVQEALSDMALLLDSLMGERVRLDLLHAPQPIAVRADRRQLEQIVMNLTVNARDAMPDGGVVEICTRLVRLEKEMQRDGAMVPRGDHVVLSVKDGGTGIAPERIGKIFDPFYTTKKPGEGTGLGLATVYGIVKQSGGFVFVDSRLGEGSVFEVWLPLCRDPAPRAAAAPLARQRLHGGAGIILLVEDEAPVRAFAARALRLHAHTVLEADSGEAALALLSDRALEVDLFVADVVMPGMDGPAWVTEARKTRPGVRTVFMSGYAEEALADVQQRVPDSVFLPKPFALRDLIDTVQSQMDSAAPPLAEALGHPAAGRDHGTGRRVS